jgi:hypothetical protein
MLLLVHKVKQTRDKLKENRRDVGRQHGSVDEMLSDRGRNGSGSDEEQGGLICLKKLEWMTPPESSLGFLLSGISVGSSAPRFFSLRQQISAPIYHRELNAEYLPRSLDLRRSARARAFQRRSLYPAGGNISADCTKRAPSRELERLYVLGGRRVKGVCGTFLFGKSHAYIYYL